jgi:hypothetical protein
MPGCRMCVKHIPSPQSRHAIWHTLACGRRPSCPKSKPFHTPICLLPRTTQCNLRSKTGEYVPASWNALPQRLAPKDSKGLFSRLTAGLDRLPIHLRPVHLSMPPPNLKTLGARTYFTVPLPSGMRPETDRKLLGRLLLFAPAAPDSVIHVQTSGGIVADRCALVNGNKQIATIIFLPPPTPPPPASISHSPARSS